MGVVVLSQYTDPQYALQFLEKGSRGRGYLLKVRVSDLDQLLAAIREVVRGGSVIDPKVIDALVAARSQASSPLRDLPVRESEVLSAMAQGRNNAAIASSLSLSERAVEKHINSLFSKLGLSEERDLHRRVKAVLLPGRQPCLIPGRFPGLGHAGETLTSRALPGKSRQLASGCGRRASPCRRRAGSTGLGGGCGGGSPRACR